MTNTVNSSAGSDVSVTSKPSEVPLHMKASAPPHKDKEGKSYSIMFESPSSSSCFQSVPYVLIHTRMLR